MQQFPENFYIFIQTLNFFLPILDSALSAIFLRPFINIFQ